MPLWIVNVTLIKAFTVLVVVVQEVLNFVSQQASALGSHREGPRFSNQGLRLGHRPVLKVM